MGELLPRYSSLSAKVLQFEDVSFDAKGVKIVLRHFKTNKANVSRTLLLPKSS